MYSYPCSFVLPHSFSEKGAFPSTSHNSWYRLGQEEATKLSARSDSLPKQNATTEQCSKLVGKISELSHSNLVTSLTHQILAAASSATKGVDFRKSLEAPQQRMRAAKVPASDFEPIVKTIYLQGLDMELPS